MSDQPHKENKALSFSCSPLSGFQNPRNTDTVPHPNQPTGFYSTLLTDVDLNAAKKRFVKVSGAGEASIEPDSIEFVVQIITIKSNLIDGRTSVKKREEYILASMKKNYIRDTDIVFNEMVTRVNSANPEDDEQNLPAQQGQDPLLSPTQDDRYAPPGPKFFRICKELHVHCDNLMKYLQISSLCNEKLDQQVTVSPPVIKFTPGVLQLFTQRAIRQAMTVAQSTANELVGSQRPPNISLGPLIYAVQDSCTTQSMTEYDSSGFESFKWKRFNKRIVCKITAVFEIVNKIGKRVV